MSESSLYSGNKRLCRLCIHGRVLRKVGMVCELTEQVPDFYAFCPNFEVFKARDDKINGNKSEEILSNLFLVFASLFIIVIVLLSLDQIFFAVSVFFIFITSYIVYYTKLPSNLIPELGWFSFMYLLTLGHVLINKKDYDEPDILIVKQQIIKLIGRKRIATANEIFKSDSQNLAKFKKYSSKLNTDQQKFIFSMCCQLYVYGNLNEYSNSSFMQEIADFLNLEQESFQKIKLKYSKAEYLFQEQLKKYNEEKRRNEKDKAENRNTGKRIYYFSSSKYYETLGLTGNVTDEQIKKKFKKLALKFHPDRYVSRTEDEQNFALEKFKEISQAYNYLKNVRGF